MSEIGKALLDHAISAGKDVTCATHGTAWEMELVDEKYICTFCQKVGNSGIWSQLRPETTFVVSS